MKSIRIAAVAATLAVCTGANAAIWTFFANLSGLNEVPPNASPATGTIMGTFDDVTKMFMMDTSVTGLTSPSTAAHIHLAPIGVNGPVQIPLSGTTGSTTYTSHDMAILTAQQESDFMADLWYVNVHSGQFPGGEVRAQIEPTVVPEPSTFLGLAIAGGLLLGLRRRR